MPDTVGEVGLVFQDEGTGVLSNCRKRGDRDVVFGGGGIFRGRIEEVVSF